MIHNTFYANLEAYGTIVALNLLHIFYIGKARGPTFIHEALK